MSASIAEIEGESIAAVSCVELHVLCDHDCDGVGYTPIEMDVGSIVIVRTGDG